MVSEVNGILLVNKPKGITSFDVVRQIRRMVHQKSVGHTGTLDPDVDGLIIIVLGAATKLIDYLQAFDKTYIGSALIGIATETEDISGPIVEEVAAEVSDTEIDAAMKVMIGKYEQIPPMFSAVKVNGTRLYEYARKGIIIERPSKTVEIKSFKRTSEVIVDETQHSLFDFEATVSKGTYIRTLLVDMADKLNYPATMTNLKRTSADGYELDDAHDLDFFNEDNISDFVLPIERILENIKRVEIDDTEFEVVKNGGFIELNSEEENVFLIYRDKVVAIYQRENNYYRPKTMLLGNLN